MRIAAEGEAAEILQRLFPSLLGNRPVSNVTPQHLRHLDVKQMRGVERLRRGKDTLVDFDASGQLKKPLDCGRGIQNNYRASRSRRTACAAETGFVLNHEIRKSVDKIASG